MLNLIYACLFFPWKVSFFFDLGEFSYNNNKCNGKSIHTKVLNTLFWTHKHGPPTIVQRVTSLLCRLQEVGEISCWSQIGRDYPNSLLWGYYYLFYLSQSAYGLIHPILRLSCRPLTKSPVGKSSPPFLAYFLAITKHFISPTDDCRLQSD